MFIQLAYHIANRMMQILSPLLCYMPGKAGVFFCMQKKWKEIITNQKIPTGGFWVHAASVGEYEQAKPLMEELKKQFPGKPVVLSFFSPSGYRFLEKKTLADYTVILPLDTKKNAEKFIELLQPSVAIFIKYEIWPNFLHVLKKKNVPTFLVSAVFRENQRVFRFPLLKNALKKINGFFVQDEKSAVILKKNHFTNVYVTGDTRFDTVSGLPKEKVHFPLVESFSENNRVLIAGSTWPEDEDLLIDFFETYRPAGWKLFLIPHEPSTKHIQRILKKTRLKTSLYSKFDAKSPDALILIGDVMGLLKYVYRYATVSYIGGGFGKGIHNTLEAAVYGKPLIFGPRYQKFKEARDLVRNEGAFVVHSKEDLQKILSKITKKSILEKIARENIEYVKNNTGAARKIVEILKKSLN